jgi:hypothetical protein
MPEGLLAPAKRRITPARPRAIMFQNFYAPGQEKKLDPAFVPHDGTRNARTDYREVALFVRMYHAGQHKAADYTGIVSPKFGEKTRISGADFLRFVERNPGYDVYFINPYPINAYYSFNVWEHGEICHAGLIAVAQDLFDRAGIQCDLATLGRNSHATLLYCNYWLGNERFWDRFIDLNLRLLRAAESLPPRARERLFALDPEYPDPVPILPFVFERVFSTLLLLDSSLKGCAYPLSRDYILQSGAGAPDEPVIGASFMDIVDEIDRRGEYNERDMAIFRSLQQLKRLLNGRVS